jgi:hypothetical protein
LAGVLEKEVSHQQVAMIKESVLDMSEWMSRVALETGGQAILGYSFDPLDSPYNNPYTSAVKELMWVTSPLNVDVLIIFCLQHQPDYLLLVPRAAVCACSN